MHRQLSAALIGLAVLVNAVPAAAQTGEPLVSDRPDFTESAETIAPGRVQVEAGITRQESGEEEALSVGEILVRIGLGERLEARLGVGSWTRLDLPGGRLDGYEDPSLGLKVRLASAPEGGPRGLPAAALLVGTSVPVGSAELTTDEWEPEAILSLAWTFTDRLSLGANLGVAFPSADGDRFEQLVASAALGIAATGRLGVFVEAFGYSEEEPGGEATQYVDGGVTFSITDDLQLDARVGFGLNDPSPERFVGVGAAVRW